MILHMMGDGAKIAAKALLLCVVKAHAIHPGGLNSGSEPFMGNVR